MRSHTVFEDLSRVRGRLERPGYWQNRRGFAFSPHCSDAHDHLLPVRLLAAAGRFPSGKDAG